VTGPVNLRPWALLTTLWLAQGALLTGYLQFAFVSNRLGALMHLELLGFALTLCLLCFTSRAARSVPAGLRRWTLALLLACAHWCLLLIYGLMLVGFSDWGGPITTELIRAYAGQLNGLLTASGISGFLGLSLCMSLWLLLVFAYYAAGRALLLLPVKPGHDSSRSQGSIFSQPDSRWRFYGWIFVGIFSLAYWASRPDWLNRELLHLMQGEVAFVKAAPAELFLNLEQPPVLTPAELNPDMTRIKPRPLVLITVDALRSDQMGVYGGPEANTPFLTDLWRHGQIRRIDSAYSVSTSSFCGLLGTLASKYWHQLTSRPLNLADILKGYGYHNRFLLSGDHTSFFGLRRFYGSNIDLYRDGSSGDVNYANDDRNVLRWLKDLDWTGDQPAFLFIHLMSVHQLGLRQPEFKRWHDPELSSLNLLGNSASPEAFQANYYNGILQADDTIRQIFHTLEEQGVLEDGLIIISADHGEYLGEFGYLSHNREPLEPVTRIPLLIYDRSATQYPVRSLVSQVDIAPTFLHSINASIPADWSGIPLQVSSSRNLINMASYEASGIVAQLPQGRYKYLRYNHEDAERLYNLDSANGENANLSAQPGASVLLGHMRELHQQSLQKSN
jgi:hypothetical protein